MIFFVYLMFIFFIISGIYKYNKNFKNTHQLSMYIFKKILLYLEYNVDDFNLELLPTKLIIIGSHTSIYDFIIGSLFYYGYLYSKYDSYVLMKKQFELYTKPIVNSFDIKMKLIPIDSTKKGTGITEQICDTLKDKNNYIIYIAPEGTRKCTNKLKSGYWHISKKLDIDILYIGIDFYKKEIILEKHRKYKESWEDEQIEFIKCCKKYIPLYPERCYWTKNFYTDSSPDSSPDSSSPDSSSPESSLDE